MTKMKDGLMKTNLFMPNTSLIIFSISITIPKILAEDIRVAIENLKLIK